MHRVDDASGRETLLCYNEAYRLRMNIPDYVLNNDGSYSELPDHLVPPRYRNPTDWGAPTHPSVASRNPQRRMSDGSYSSIPPWELNRQY